jgi:adenine phosphoribosyltransferase
MNQKELRDKLRVVPGFPKEGINFIDITTLVRDGKAFREVMDHLFERYTDTKLDAIIGIESRGFIFAGALADRLGVGFIPARKPGKLPADTISQSYDLEYGQATLEIHKDAIKKGEKILIIDDLMATGGTLEAVGKLVNRLGGEVVEIWVLVELSFLHGTDKISQYPYYSLLKYDSE